MSLAEKFRDAPIKSKLLLVGLLIPAGALLLVSLIQTALDIAEWRERTVSAMTTYADIAGANAAPALMFDDQNAAAETLSALSVNPDIVDAIIYDNKGNIFVRFIVPQHSAQSLDPIIQPGTHLFDINQLVVTEPIRFKGEEVGSIYLESTLNGFYADILRDTALTFGAALGIFLLAFFLSSRLQKAIANPILDLSDGMRDVAARQDYAVRVGVYGKDEIGMLARTFNAMLERIQQTQEELVRKEKLAVLGQVAGSVGHELRNPLGVMSNAVFFLQAVLSDADETTKEYLDIIKDEITGSERIVSALLDSVHTKPPQPEDVSLAELLGQSLRKCGVPPSVTVRLDIAATLAPLRVDPQQIHRVLINLISNGVEAMPEGGVMKISAVENKADETIAVSVRDSGSGMTAEQLGHLFQPLFTTKARGIGLGLVVVKNLVEANGGTVTVQSEAGKGTTFTVTLPTDDAGRDSACVVGASAPYNHGVPLAGAALHVGLKPDLQAGED